MRFNYKNIAFLLLIWICNISPGHSPKTDLRLYSGDEYSGLFFRDTVKTPDNIFKNKDSVSVKDSSIVRDSSAVNNDSTAGNKFDDVVFSNSSDSITFSISQKKMNQYGKSELKYKKTELQSHTIFVDFNSKNLEAYGRPDTAKNSEKLIDTPIMSEDGEKYEGRYIKYNFDTKQGFISHAKNKMDVARYEGERIKKIDEGNYFIENGMFTTCESDTPHTHFTASRMKIVDKEAIVSEWIMMYIEGIPMPFALPFGVFPTKSGRRSGIIIPKIGYSLNNGHGFNEFGYYFALSDYYDLRLTADYYTRGGFALKSNVNYKLKYNFAGSIQAGYTYTKSQNSSSTSKNWMLRINHSQTIDPTLQVNANVSFMTNGYYQSTTIDPRQYLSSDIFSSATISKTWENASLNLGYSRSQKLNIDEYSETLPSVYFRHNTIYPFQTKSTKPSDQKWYEMIALDYSGELKNDRFKDTLKLTENFGVQHRVSVRATPRLGYFNLSPGLNYSEKWYNTRLVKTEIPVYTINNNTGKTDTTYRVNEEIKKEFAMVREFDFSVSTSTKLYGTLTLNALGVEAFRHTISPSVSYSVRPDFSTDKWGYFDYYPDHTGKKVKYGKYEKGIYGGPSQYSSQSFNFSLSNLWEMKLQKAPEDTTDQQQKITLMNMNASMSYNPDSKQWSDISMNFNTQISQKLNLSGSSTLTIYDDVQKTKKISDVGNGFIRMESFSLQFSTSFSGENNNSKTNKDDTENKQSFYTPSSHYLVDQYNNIFKPVDFSIPWNVSMSSNFYWNRGQDANFNVSVNGDLSLTEKWKISFSTSYNTREKQLIAPSLGIHRDLHCWSLDLTWVPTGYTRGYYFILQMKAPEFKDIKFEKQSDFYQGLRR